MGGGLAAVVGIITGFKTYTFNAAGVHENTLKNASAENNSLNKIKNYVNKNDLLTSFQEDSSFSFIAPNALGEQIKYGSDINGIIPGFTPYGKLLEILIGVEKHELDIK